MKQYLFIGLTILAVTSARVLREAPEEGILEEKEKIESDLTDIEKFVQNLTGINIEELDDKTVEYLELLINKFSLWIDNLSEETTQLQENEVFKDLRQKFEHCLENLRKKVGAYIAKFEAEHPDTYKFIDDIIGIVTNGTWSI